ncbi:hypothetical protein [Phaeovulum sp. W22_SRMD_FR3]|uniref:hypothetical protein n=1 Tax=Phaeovulum sp. W22_SRMD_FR3 TaxID=3240274 RepID=UPI003F96CF8C
MTMLHCNDNADEMAIGALQATKSSGMDLDKVVIAGIDGGRDALAAIQVSIGRQSWL